VHGSDADVLKYFLRFISIIGYVFLLLVGADRRAGADAARAWTRTKRNKFERGFSGCIRSKPRNAM
jgi:hypothetical protein